MRFRTSLFAFGCCVVACAWVVGCSPSALTETVALDRLREHKSLHVAPEDVKVLGITDGETERIVKVDFGGNIANVKFRRFNQGWSPEQIETIGGSWLALDAGFTMETDKQQEAATSYLKSIALGQAAYAATCGKGFYAPSFMALMTPGNGESVGYLSDEPKPTSGNSFVEKEHYRFEIKTPPLANSPASCNGVPAGASGETFSATAAPKKGYAGNSYQVDLMGQVSVMR